MLSMKYEYNFNFEIDTHNLFHNAIINSRVILTLHFTTLKLKFCTVPRVFPKLYWRQPGGATKSWCCPASNWVTFIDK